MLRILKPLSASTVCRYHAEELSNPRETSYSNAHQVCSGWHGRLAQAWDLERVEGDAPFRRLAEGRDPLTEEPLVRHRAASVYVDARGRLVETMTHRAAFESVVSAPKSVSLTALLGADPRVREAHVASATTAFNELERYVQVRASQQRDTTGCWVAARFEHDTARPVDGYGAPHLHTHLVIFNLSRTRTGAIRAIHGRELFRTQQYATAVYRSELATRLTALGYEIERGAHGQPEICGYSAAYISASSPRRRQIEAYLAQRDMRGAVAAQIAAFQTRRSKAEVFFDQAVRQHREMTRAFGDQPAHVVRAAFERTHSVTPRDCEIDVRAAVTASQKQHLDRGRVIAERTLISDTLGRGLGTITLDAVRAECERRLRAGEFVQIERGIGAPGRAFATPQTRALHEEVEGQQAREKTRMAVARSSAGAGARLFKAIADQLAHGDAGGMIRRLESEGRLQVIEDREQRLKELTREYLRQPGTLLVAPDYESRTALNRLIHRTRREHGEIACAEHHLRVLVLRAEIAGVDRHEAVRYQPGDVVHYWMGHQASGLPRGNYARVVDVNEGANLITLTQKYGAQFTCEPRSLRGRSFQEVNRAFAVGDRVRITAPDRSQPCIRAELGTILSIEAPSVRLRLDSGRVCTLRVDGAVHLDHGYATNGDHRGHQFDRLLLHIDLQSAHPHGLSRWVQRVFAHGRSDGRIYTNDRERLIAAFSRDVSHVPLRERSQALTPVARAASHELRQEQHSIGLAL